MCYEEIVQVCRKENSIRTIEIFGSSSEARRILADIRSNYKEEETPFKFRIVGELLLFIEAPIFTAKDEILDKILDMEVLGLSAPVEGVLGVHL